MSGVCVSVISHDQMSMVNEFLSELSTLAPSVSVKVTSNLLSENPVVVTQPLVVHQVHNRSPKGFGANHNAAFERCDTPFFCIVNPDIHLVGSPFEKLLEAMKDPRVGVVAPVVVNPSGVIEDNARYFPTPFNLWKKMMMLSDGRHEIKSSAVQPVEWTAGMFMLFRAEAFRDIGGFDEKFFLYYEDVDICARLWSAGWKVVLHPGVTVVHNAQRTSHRSLKYMRWHLASMMRYFFKHLGRLPRVDRLI